MSRSFQPVSWKNSLKRGLLSHPISRLFRKTKGCFEVCAVYRSLSRNRLCCSREYSSETHVGSDFVFDQHAADQRL